MARKSPLRRWGQRQAAVPHILIGIPIFTLAHHCSARGCQGQLALAFAGGHPLQIHPISQRCGLVISHPCTPLSQSSLPVAVAPNSASPPGGGNIGASGTEAYRDIEQWPAPEARRTDVTASARGIRQKLATLAFDDASKNRQAARLDIRLRFGCSAAPAFLAFLADDRLSSPGSDIIDTQYIVSTGANRKSKKKKSQKEGKK
ncbi:hypothetical protein VUR80DRAFT_9509 [Thermomyces stellatus]